MRTESTKGPLPLSFPIRGMDLSTLREVEKCGGKFYDGGGAEDAMAILKRYGMNLLRLRLWNDPRSETGEPYGAGNCDIDTVMHLAGRAVKLGIPWMLDLHYSDFWADPGKQIPPKAWTGFDADETERAVYGYTRDVLEALIAGGIAPSVTAVGNEVSNGLLWPLGRRPDYDNITRFISAGIRAVREVSPETRVMIHLDNGGDNKLYREWFDSYLARGGEDFDFIGLSYYPFWHGPMSGLGANMVDIAGRYGKPLIVVETSMGFSLTDYKDKEGLTDGQRRGMAAREELASSLPWPMTPEGQRDYLREMIQTIGSVPGGLGQGLVWWEPAWIPVPGSHWASPAALEYIHERGPGGNEWANQALFDYDGNALPALGALSEYR